jgi:hypothetical protein
MNCFVFDEVPSPKFARRNRCGRPTRTRPWHLAAMNLDANVNSKLSHCIPASSSLASFKIGVSNPSVNHL